MKLGLLVQLGARIGGEHARSAPIAATHRGNLQRGSLSDIGTLRGIALGDESQLVASLFELTGKIPIQFIGDLGIGSGRRNLSEGTSHEASS